MLPSSLDSRIWVDVRYTRLPFRSTQCVGLTHRAPFVSSPDFNSRSASRAPCGRFRKPQPPSASVSVRLLRLLPPRYKRRSLLSSCHTTFHSTPLEHTPRQRTRTTHTTRHPLLQKQVHLVASPVNMRWAPSAAHRGGDGRVEAPVTLRGYLLCVFAAFGGILFGYDSGKWTSILFSRL